jgi:5-formyltetrahydrofolate cyclo-ligase
MNKRDLRTTYKQQRKTLNQSTIDNLSLQIANQTLKLPIWDASFFHIFMTIKHLKEIETEPLISILFGKDKNIVIPKSNISTGEMTHFLLTDNTVIKPNIWNIPEPNGGIQIQNEQIEVVFVPLLAFDEKGHRVGYGKGFYDTFLKNCPNAIKIGLSFFEAEPTIEDNQTYDVPLDYCITPNRVYFFE